MDQDSDIVTSRDGSHTLYSKKYNAHYHSVYGAIDESIHVFIAAGLYYLHRKSYTHARIFEMGMGTGLNALLTLLSSDQLGMNISYHTVESDPMPFETVAQLNYPEILGLSAAHTQHFSHLHQADWGRDIEITPSFTLTKWQDKIESLDLSDNYDLVYYDAFAPSAQPELWEKEIHGRIFNALNTHGVLVTYCAQGRFKRMLKELGYRLEILNGPGKKREMVRAIKQG